MSIEVKLRRGTTSAHSTFTGALGEITIDTDKNTVVVHDGVTAGGHPLLSSSSTVDSVNGQTGEVVLDAADVGAATTAQGALADSAVQPADLATVATTGAYSDLTGRPTLGSAAGQDATAFATAAQGAKADTAVQPAAIANMLETSDIGVSVQAYNANYVVDAGYVHTDNNYTTTEKTKLAGIAAGAEVNVNADWNATSGDAQILNKPTLATVATSGAYADLTGRPLSLSAFTNDTGFITDTALTPYLTSAAAATTYVSLTGSYSNPAWITSLAYSKLSGAPTSVSAFANDSGYITSSALTPYLTSAAAATTYQPLDADLTAWSSVAPTSKQDTLISGTNIKSINSNTLLGSGNIELFSGGLVKVSVVTSLPGTPDANTLYIVTG